MFMLRLAKLLLPACLLATGP
ncbi:MAG: hypothetical protein K0R58_3763, partial [Ramlibacter sp.]|nr:hypothetical protein [Ramlibacter sp.]